MSRFILALLLWGATLAGAAPADDFQRIVDAHWQWHLQQYPQLRTQLGDSSANDRWEDMSLAAHIARDARRSEFLAQLAAIDVAALSDQEQLSHAMLLQRLQGERAAQALGLHLMPVNIRSGPQHLHTLAEQIDFRREQDYRAWLVRLQALPDLLLQYRELLEEGILQQRTQARIVMER
ncbi:MAG: DUF885 family protein, partial [Haliea sp.]